MDAPRWLSFSPIQLLIAISKVWFLFRFYYSPTPSPLLNDDCLMNMHNKLSTYKCVSSKVVFENIVFPQTHIFTAWFAVVCQCGNNVTAPVGNRTFISPVLSTTITHLPDVVRHILGFSFLHWWGGREKKNDVGKGNFYPIAIQKAKTWLSSKLNVTLSIDRLENLSPIVWVRFLPLSNVSRLLVNEYRPTMDCFFFLRTCSFVGYFIR